ncbi:hypothetical protein NQ314_011001 [Rhamnusium bicolor]|uniref:Glucose-methanol-choline oxidoreductase N-terminal domain-containing protein n=1 Tax=Rhamnusium bicolor TaxID=1586634 RepID=A0AAV8XMD1_9CUCU|nr:hypothetical protein NQ314_011001 [Rhamnusium bicolor]
MPCNCPVTQPGPTLASTCGGAQYMLFMGLLEVFLRSQCDLEDPCGRPESTPLFPEYDFIIVGAGSAGSVVASLDEPTGTQVPSMFLNFIGSDIDWRFQTEPETQACLAENERRCSWPRGKVIGGTSVMNGMMYIRGSRKDYDDWAEMGNDGWSYNEILPYFLKSEDNKQIDEMDRGYHSKGGLLTVSQFPYHPPLDLNGNYHTGFAIAQTTNRNGSRLSTARAFLRPFKHRRNLHILMNATVSRVLINTTTKQAYGVEVLNEGKKQIIYASKEVIVSGGAVNSPQILLLSGVGPRDELQKVNVPVVHDLPGVGKNLQNHVAFYLNFNINDTNSTPLNWATAMEYLLFRDGLMSGTGSIRLRDNKPLTYPLIYANYFTHPDDVKVIVEGIKIGLKLSQTKALKRYGFQLDRTPVAGCQNLTFGSDSYWACAVRQQTGPENHQCGSCKMGPPTDTLAVVNPALQVYGIDKLRVIDASIMPKVPSGNTNAPAIMVAEKGADLIKSRWLTPQDGFFYTNSPSQRIDRQWGSW